MAVRDFDAIFYASHSPEICFERGMFHVSYDVGKRARFEFVLPPHVFIKAMRLGSRALSEFHEGSNNVTQLAEAGDEADEAVTAH